MASKRKVYSYLEDKKIVDKVFDVLGKRYQKRDGGYVRILKSGYRYGDSAPKAIIELVERDINAKGFDDKNRIKEKEKNNNNEKIDENMQIPKEVDKSNEKNTTSKKTMKINKDEDLDSTLKKKNS